MCRLVSLGICILPFGITPIAQAPRGNPYVRYSFSISISFVG